MNTTRTLLAPLVLVFVVSVGTAQTSAVALRSGNGVVCAIGTETRCWRGTSRIELGSNIWLSADFDGDPSVCTCDRTLACRFGSAQAALVAFPLRCDAQTPVRVMPGSVCSAGQSEGGVWCADRSQPSVIHRIPGSPHRVQSLVLSPERPRASPLPELCIVSAEHRLFCGTRQGVSLTRSGITAVAQGRHHLCRLRTDHVVECTGDNTLGQLALPARIASSRGFRTVRLPPALELVAGLNFTCARASEGVFCWGSLGCEPMSDPLRGGLDGAQLRATQLTQTRVPVRIANTEDAVSITASGTLACALGSAGAVTCWGCQLGPSALETVQCR